ncbi:retrotransposon protein, putative, ty1-copia subclass, partial [Tanacetum coccineum]
MTGAKFDIEKFDGTGDFRLCRVKMRALLIQHGCEAALEDLPEDMEAQAKSELNKKAHSAVILCLGNKVLREVTGETTAAGVWTKLETLYMTKSLANKLYLKKKLYTCYKPRKERKIDHLKRNCPTNNRKKSTGYVKKDDLANSSDFIYDDYGVMMVMSVEALLDWIMDSGGSYHMTPKLDIFFDFLECDRGNVLLGDNGECKIKGIGKGTLKLQSGKVKVINGSKVVLSGTRRDNCAYSLDGHAVAGELNASVKEKDSPVQEGMGLYPQEFKQLCIESGIARHLIVAGMPQQNGLAECMNRTLMDKVCYLLIQSGLPKTFWAEATCTAAYLINRSPSTTIEKKTP